MKIKTVLLLTALAWLGLPQRASTDTVDIREWLVPWKNSEPRNPFVDNNGKVWFASLGGNYLANLSPESGQFNRYDLMVGDEPFDVLVDAEGSIWFTAAEGRHIGKLNAATGRVNRVKLPDRKARDPHSLTLDQDGNIWFTVHKGNFVGRLEPQDNSVRLIEVPTRKSLPGDIAIGRAGEAWVAAFGKNLLLRIDPATLAIEEIELPREKSRPASIISTADGVIWYADHALGALGRFDPATLTFTEWPMPGGEDSKPYGLVSDRNDRIWIVETGRSPNRLVGFDASSLAFLTQTDIPSGADLVQSLHYYEAAGEVWFATDTNYVGRAKVH